MTSSLVKRLIGEADEGQQAMQMAVEKLHQHFVEQRVKGFTWDQLVHHPIPRQEAEKLWDEVKDVLVKAIFAGAEGQPAAAAPAPAPAPQAAPRAGASLTGK